jgi:hypothetical protein
MEMIMKRSKRTQSIRRISGITAGLLLAMGWSNTGQAYDTYDAGCSDCHGVFDGPTSPKGTVFPSDSKHTMHNGKSNMNTECDLCHTTGGRTPVFIGSSDGVGAVSGQGCSGCHVGSGLRKHHTTRGVTACYSGGSGCHGDGTSETSPAENVISPYYYTAAYNAGYTLAHNPGNTVQVANTNENWSVGDFVGLDNDGNGLADLADYSVGPFRLQSVAREGNDLRVTWLTAGGRTNTVQSAGSVSGNYTNLSTSTKIAGVGLVTTNYLEVGGATKGSHFFRLKSQ